MPLTLIKSQVDRFLASETPEVISIRGAWGVGKTFAWKRYIAEASKENRIALDDYAYVSLFGLNSLDELKLSIFMQVVHGKHIGTENNKRTMVVADKKLSSLSRKAIQLLKGLPYARDLWPTIQSVTFHSLTKTIICIDDFERKGKELDAQDIMGLVSFLKEQKACKIALILNDQLLDDNTIIDYRKYREKVIDIELLFNPTVLECADIALPTNTIGTKLKDFVVKLKISNIRIIKKLENLSGIVVPLLSGFEEEVVHLVLHSLTLFTWCFYSRDIPSVPDFEFVRNFRFDLLGFGGDKDNEPENEKAWKAILRQYEYLSTDGLDLQIARAVEQGYVDQDEFIAEATKSNEQIVASKSQDSFRKAWELYHNTFDNNEKELVEKLFDSLETNLKHIGPRDLDGTLKLFRLLGKEDLADQMIEIYIRERYDEIGLLSLDSFPYKDYISDRKLLERLTGIFQAKQEKRTLRDVLSKIAGKDGWSGDDEEVLSNATVDEYYAVFKTEKGHHLSNWVDTCLQFGRFSNASDRMTKISDKASEALRRIGEESALNLLRVKKYGIQPRAKKEGNCE